MEDYMENLEKAFDNYVEKAITDYKQENYNGKLQRNSIKLMVKVVMKVFNEAFKKFEIEV